jgi:hypothetical protein
MKYDIIDCFYFIIFEVKLFSFTLSLVVAHVIMGPSMPHKLSSNFPLHKLLDPLDQISVVAIGIEGFDIGKIYQDHGLLTNLKKDTLFPGSECWRLVARLAGRLSLNITSS